MDVTAEELFEKIKEIPADMRRYIKIVVTSNYHEKYSDVDGSMEIDDFKITNDHIILESDSVNQEIVNLQNQIDDAINDKERVIEGMEAVIAEYKKEL